MSAFRSPLRQCALYSTALVLAIPLQLVGAQPTEVASIKAAVAEFFTAMQNHDTPRMKQLTLDGATITSIGVAADGSVRNETRTIQGLIDGVSQAAQTWTETLSNQQVQVQASTAHLTTNYKFLINGGVVHCGTVDVMLVKTAGKWALAHIAETQVTSCG